MHRTRARSALFASRVVVFRVYFFHFICFVQFIGMKLCVRMGPTTTTTVPKVLSGKSIELRAMNAQTSRWTNTHNHGE